VKTISIVGLGWLGMPLAQRLRGQGFVVRGSKTTMEGVQAARLSGIAAYQLQLTPEPEGERAALQELLSSELLIITLPASRTVTTTNDYLQAIQILVDSAMAYGQLRRIIFTSSTSVYGDSAGAGVCTEATPPNPVTSAGKTVLQVEQWLHALPGMAVDILRLAGLVGANRHPGRFLAGRQGLAQGRQGVNLVHQTDVIEAMILLINSSSEGRVFNLCAERHPARAEYYPTVARALGLKPPEFIDEAVGNNEAVAKHKVIDGSAICRTLGFRYQFSDPYRMI
jgi:nucleoside-diphosphate-sugar epimerase